MISDGDVSASLDAGSTILTDGSGDGIVLADGDLLFTGEYSRAADDLVLTGENGSQLRIENYFSTDDLPDLQSEDGAVLRGETIELLAGPRAPGQYAQASGDTGSVPVGEVGQLIGFASVQQADGTRLDLQEGSPIFQGDVIATGPNGPT